MSYERYREKRNQAKRVVPDARMNADVRWCRKLIENVQKNITIF